MCKGCATGLLHTSSHGLHNSVAIYVGKTGSNGAAARGNKQLEEKDQCTRTCGHMHGRVYIFIFPLQFPTRGVGFPQHSWRPPS